MTTVIRRLSSSVELITVTVTGSVDPTGDAVTIAASAVGVAPTVWLPATWAGPATAVGTQYTARAHTQATVSLAAGQYKVFAKIADSPETPEVECGYIVVTDS